MIHETSIINREPAILVRLSLDEAREFLALDEEGSKLLDSLVASGQGAGTLELYLVPLRMGASYRVGAAGPVETDYDEALYSLEGIDRSEYLEILDRAARIVAREIRAWDTEDVARLVELLTLLDDITDRADRRADDYVRMDSLPSAPIPEGIDTGYPVWAVDTRGMALVGPGADEVESVEEVRAVCEEQAERMRGVPLRCHKCGYTWVYRGGSQYRTTCPGCKITVYLDKCEVSRTGSERV